MIFFFKQKTAYEMRISDWSSDVCSSDLQGRRTVRCQDLQSQRGADLGGRGRAGAHGDRSARLDRQARASRPPAANRLPTVEQIRMNRGISTLSPSATWHQSGPLRTTQLIEQELRSDKRRAGKKGAGVF